MRILSLCTGYGGLDLAVEAVTGARTVAVADIDRGASKILAHRFPHAPNLGDLKRIDWAAWAGVEVMTAGYPCQPFSHAGKREGTDDPRHIFPEIARGIREVGPRLVVLENVRGHLALGFDTVLGALADIGYDARWVCVRASDVGAPHKRERMFIAATPHDASRFGGNEAVELDGHRATPRDGSSVPDEPDSRPGGARPGDGGATTAHAGSGQLSRPSVEHDGLLVPAERGCVPAPDSRSQRHGRGEDGRGLGRLDRPHEGRTRQWEWSREVAGDRSAATGWGQYGAAIGRWAATLGRPAPAPAANGRLAPAFVEWMMGLPAGWVTEVPDLSRTEQLKALGNGVVPQQAAAALTHLLEVEERAA